MVRGNWLRIVEPQSWSATRQAIRRREARNILKADKYLRIYYNNSASIHSMRLIEHDDTDMQCKSMQNSLSDCNSRKQKFR